MYILLCILTTVLCTCTMPYSVYVYVCVCVSLCIESSGLFGRSTSDKDPLFSPTSPSTTTTVAPSTEDRRTQVS